MVKRGNGYDDLTGKRFNRLLVIRDSETRKERNVLWECLCNCGNIVNVTGRNLKTGNNKSCGCLSKEVRGKSRRKDLTGKRFGKLLVLESVESNKKRRQWLCRCDCGKNKITSGCNLTSKKVMSCGCYQLESRTGANCHLWKGGISKDPYNHNWNGSLKNKIRERDNYTCQLCNKKQTKEKLSIHHIDYNKQNINEYNLISLCRSCHTKTNHLRDKWVFPLQVKSGYWRCYE